METINQMQTNCSGLTQNAAEIFPKLTTPDYCSLTFNTSDLAFALKSIQLQAYGNRSTVFGRISTDRTAVTLECTKFNQTVIFLSVNTFNTILPLTLQRPSFIPISLQVKQS